MAGNQLTKEQVRTMIIAAVITTIVAAGIIILMASGFGFSGPERCGCRPFSECRCIAPLTSMSCYNHGIAVSYSGGRDEANVINLSVRVDENTPRKLNNTRGTWLQIPLEGTVPNQRQHIIVVAGYRDGKMVIDTDTYLSCS